MYPHTNLDTAPHTLAYLCVMTLAARIVYRRLGLGFLRTAWFNLDWVWAGALAVAGVAVLFDSRRDCLPTRLSAYRVFHLYML